MSPQSLGRACKGIAALLAIAGATLAVHWRFTTLQWIGQFLGVLAIAIGVYVALAPRRLDVLYYVLTVVIALTSASYMLSHDFTPRQYVGASLVTLCVLIGIIVTIQFVSERKGKRGDASSP